MDLTLSLDLEGILKAAVTTDKIQPLIDKAVIEAVGSAIREATGYGSPFVKEVKKQLTEAMPHGLSIDDTARFQQVFNAALTSAVHGANSETIKVAIEKAMVNALPDVPTRIKLSDVVKQARDSFHLEEHESFFAKYEASEHGGGHLYFDGDKSIRRNYDAKFRIAFTQEGEVYTLRMDGVQIMPTKPAQAITRFEGLLLSMYVGRTTIEIDCDEDEVENLACDQTDH